MILLFLKTLFIFLATEIDDFLVYVLFFARHEASEDRRKIFLGRLLATLAAAVLCAFVAQLLSRIPWKYIRFLGIIPVAVAIHSFFSDEKNKSSGFGATALFLASFLLTCASSGDNAGVYIPFFTSLSLFQKVFSILLILLFQILWSLFQMKASQTAFIQKVLEKAGSILVPAVLILLGLSIFFGF